MVDRRLCTYRLAAAAFGVTHQHIARASVAMKESREIGIHGHPHWLCDSSEAALREKLEALIRKKIRIGCTNLKGIGGLAPRVGAITPKHKGLGTLSNRKTRKRGGTSTHA